MWHTDIHISAGFCLLATWFGTINGWDTLAVVLRAAFMHELGHWVVLRLEGAEIKELRIGIAGAVLHTNCGKLSYGAELIAVLAGPGVNLACAWVLLKLDPEKWAVEAGAHLVLCIFNLFPIRPLDGGRAVCLFFSWIMGPDKGERLTAGISCAAGCLMACFLLIIMVKSEGSLWLVPAVTGLLLAAKKERMPEDIRFVK